MTPSASQLDLWVERLSQSRLPMQRRCRQEINALFRKPNLNTWQFAQVAARDPLLTTLLLRHANRGKEGVVFSIEQSILMLGESAVRSLVIQAPDLEDLVPQEWLRVLRQIYRRNIFSASLARQMGSANRDHRFEEAYAAGLMLNLGELCVRAMASDAVIECLYTVPEGTSLEVAWQHQRGFTLDQLTAALAKSWELPTLLSTALNPDLRKQDRRAKLLGLATDISANAWRGLLQREMEPRYKMVGEILHQAPSAVPAEVWSAHAGAGAALVSWYPNMKGDGEFVPLMPAPPRNPKLERAAATCRGQRREGSNEAAHHEPARPPVQESTAVANEGGAPQFNPESLRQACSQFIAAIEKHLKLTAMVVVGRQWEGSGLLQLFSRPESGDGSSVEESEVVTRLLQKPLGVWIRAEDLGRYEGLLAHYPETGECLVHSLFVRNQPWGYCVVWSDNISEATVAAFKRACMVLMLNLRGL